jgi:hypothetical protein
VGEVVKRLVPASSDRLSGLLADALHQRMEAASVSDQGLPDHGLGVGIVKRQ